VQGAGGRKVIRIAVFEGQGDGIFGQWPVVAKRATISGSGSTS
jgi:hypothetical protein